MNPKFNLPLDQKHELYFDSKDLVVRFRPRAQKSQAHVGYKVLRVVVMAYSKIIDDRIFEPGTKITIGESKRNTFQIPTFGLPDRFELFHYQKDGSNTLNVPTKASGVVQMQDHMQQLAQMQGASLSPTTKSLMLSPGANGFIEMGTILVYFECVADPEKIPVIPFPKNLISDPKFGKWLLISVGLHLMLLLLLKILPKAEPKTKLEDLPQHFQKIVVDPSSTKTTPTRFLKLAESAQPLRGSVGQEGEGERAAGAEGRRGKGMKGRGGPKTSATNVNKTGVLDFFSKGNKGVLSDLIGSGSGIEGNLDKMGTANARYGLPGEREYREGKGLQGTGTGGGGREGSTGQGLGTKGRGGGAKGTGLADFGTGKGDVAVSASIDDEEVYIMGNISKAEIDRIIKNHLGQIQRCYSQELVRNPGLRGKIVINFVIGLQGAVTSSRIQQTSMKNANVESCIQSVVRRMPFPKPGGGVVEVIYPFTFRVAG